MLCFWLLPHPGFPAKQRAPTLIRNVARFSMFDLWSRHQRQ
jgi:hypothetical protein